MIDLTTYMCAHSGRMGIMAIHIELFKAYRGSKAMSKQCCGPRSTVRFQDLHSTYTHHTIAIQVVSSQRYYDGRESLPN